MSESTILIFIFKLIFRIDWLFRLSDNLYPSIYLDARLTPREKTQMIEGRINEAKRVANINNKTKSLKILPYFWYKYHGGQTFLTKVKSTIYKLFFLEF